MAEEQSLNENLDSFVDALRSLTPRSDQRDRLVFEIRQATTERELSSARIRLRSWQLATGVSALVASTFAAMWFANLTSQPDPAKVEAAVHWPERVEVQAVSPHPQRIEFGTQAELPTADFAASYIRQRNRALSEGIDSIPVPRVSGGSDVTGPRTCRELLESIHDSQESGG